MLRVNTEPSPVQIALYSSSANNTTGRYDERVTYNANGSITSLLRNGMKNDGTFGAIDDLSIDYDGGTLTDSFPSGEGKTGFSEAMNQQLQLLLSMSPR